MCYWWSCIRNQDPVRLQKLDPREKVAMPSWHLDVPSTIHCHLGRNSDRVPALAPSWNWREIFDPDCPVPKGFRTVEIRDLYIVLGRAFGRDAPPGFVQAKAFALILYSLTVVNWSRCRLRRRYWMEFYFGIGNPAPSEPEASEEVVIAEVQPSTNDQLADVGWKVRPRPLSDLEYRYRFLRCVL